jgi:hypothetical protein
MGRDLFAVAEAVRVLALRLPDRQMVRWAWQRLR